MWRITLLLLFCQKYSQYNIFSRKYKTMLAKALSREVGARFLCIAPSNLLRKYVGETNQMVKALFSLVRRQKEYIALF